MIIKETPLKDAYVLEPRVFEDSRGYFFESYNKQTYQENHIQDYQWVQENESKSTKGVLRGLHFQKGDASQAKLVRVIQGEVYDVIVDLRQNSASYGKWHGLYLTEENKTQLLIPRGFAHGFLVMSEEAIFSYKCDNFYNPTMDSGILYTDIDLRINWPKLDVDYILSEKDCQLDSFQNSYKF